MSNAQAGTILSNTRKQSAPEPARDVTDQELLERFRAHGEETAFAALFRRYSQVVLGVCRRVLHQEQEAEDAFQAVFLVLARKAGSIRKGEAVGSWLYGVAYRIAMKARQKAGRRQELEKRARQPQSAPEAWSEAACREMHLLLDQEVQRLPKKYRAPFVLCCLEGLSKSEASRELGWKEGTVSGRLALARKLLQKRLLRRGVTLSALLTAAALAHPAAASAALIQSTVPAVLAPAGSGASASLSPSVLALANHFMRAMAIAKIKTRGALVLALAVMICGAGWFALRGGVGGFTGLLTVSEPDVFVEPPVALGTPVDEQVFTLAFSPDGKKLVTAGGTRALPGQLQLWDVTTGGNLVTIRALPGVRSVAFSPDGQDIATGGYDGQITLREGDTALERSAVKAHDGGVTSVAYSADGASIVSGGLDGTVRLWDAKRLKERKAFLGHTDIVSSVAFFGSADAVVSGSNDKTAIIWDVKTGKQRLVLRGHRSEIEAVAVSPNDRLVATAGSDHTVKLWDAETGKESAELTTKDRAIAFVAFSPAGALLAGALDDGTIQLWNVTSPTPFRVLEKHAKKVWALAFSKDGLLASGSADKTAKLWSLGNGKQTASLNATPAVIKPILALAYTPDGKVVGMATTDPLLQIRDAKTGDVLSTLPGHTDRVNCLAFSPGGQTLASGSSDRTVKLWDWATGQERLTLKGHSGEVFALAFSPDGKTLASAGQDKTIRLWDALSGRPLGAFEEHAASIHAVAFAPDVRSLASGGADQTIRLWDLSRQTKPAVLNGHQGAVRALTFSAAGILASAGDDETIKLWEAGQGEVRLALKGHIGPVLTLAFTPGGRTLVSGGHDRSVRVWDANTGQLKATLKGHQEAVTCLAVHPRGQNVLSGSFDTMALRWQGAKSQAAVAPVDLSRTVQFDLQRKELRALDAIILPKSPDNLDVRDFDVHILSLSSPDTPAVFAPAQALVLADTDSKRGGKGWLGAGLIIGLMIAMTVTLGLWFYARSGRPSGATPPRPAPANGTEGRPV